MNLDIDALRAFVAVADERSFTRGARAVSRTQSAVSVQIKTFEGRLGFALFERTKRSVALTPRGVRLLAYARDILRLNDDGVRELTGPRVRGHLRLGITEYFAPEHMPPLLAQFSQQHPSLVIEVVAGVTGTLRVLQQAGELDVVIGRGELGTTEGEPLRRERLRWVARQGFRLGPQAPVPLVLLPLGCGVRALALAALDQLRRPWRATYCGPSVLGVQAAVAAGLGVACLTSSALREDFRLLGAREGLPPLPDSQIVLFGPGPEASQQLKELTLLVREHFSRAIPVTG